MVIRKYRIATIALTSAALVACSGADEQDPSEQIEPGSTSPDPSDPESTSPDPSEPSSTDVDPTDSDPSVEGPLGCEGRVSLSEPCTRDPNPCGIDSGFEGDEYCLLPPPEGEGIQLHFGPKDYNDPAELAKYTIEPGEEFNSYGIAHVPLTEDRWFKRVQIQMRPGSHHLINSIVEGKPEEGYLPLGQDCPGTRLSGFPGTQNLVLDSPPNGVPAPENEGLGRLLPGNSSICHNHHAYNFTETTQLREIWVNVWFADESEVTQRANGIVVIAGPWSGIEPGTQQTVSSAVDITESGRIISLFGHRHAHTERFAVWKNEDLVYDSWNWEESIVFDYDSITENPAPNPEAKTDGAHSGILPVEPGDQIYFECDINNTSTETLFFRNALYDGEMCILFGQSVDVSIGGGFGGFGQ